MAKDNEAKNEEQKPRKMRTWWHPLLACVLRWLLGKNYEVKEEVSIGEMPLQLDYLLLRRNQEELPESARRVLAGLVEHLNEYTLLELKSPSEKLRAGDFLTLQGYVLLWLAQNDPLLSPKKLNVVLLAPRLTTGYKDELRNCGGTATQTSNGVWQLSGGTIIHSTWVLETEVLGDLLHPMLTVFSPRLLREGGALTQQLRQQGYEDLVVFLTQQIQQFRLEGEEFRMQHSRTDDEMQKAWDELLGSLPPEELRRHLTVQQLLEGVPPEDRLKGLPPEERLKGLPPEERLKGLPPEDRLKGLPPEDRLKGLSPEDRQRLLRLLQQE